MEDTFENSFAELEKKVIASVEKFLLRILQKIHADADRIIRDGKAIATGELVKNIREQVYQEAGMLVGVVGVGANVPYGIYRHEGTKPHFPPIDAIKKWVVIKGLLRDKGKPTTLRRVKGNIAQDSQLNSIAFLIARKISQRGTSGLAFLRLALNQNVGYIQSQIKTLTI